MNSKAISAEEVFRDSKKLLFLGANSSTLFYLETKSEENGRATLMSIHGEEMTPFPFNLKTRVNTYGGKCFTLSENSLFFFSDHDQSLYRSMFDRPPQKLFDKKNTFFADLDYCKKRDSLYAIMQSDDSGNEKCSVICLSVKSQTMTILHEAEDFYACPKISPCGRFLAFISWIAPYMPWDQTRVWLYEIETEKSKIIYDAKVSTTELLWTFESTLIFNSEVKGFWNLYEYDHSSIRAITDLNVEFGIAHWIFGVTRFCQINSDELIAIGTKNAQDSLYLIDLKERKIKKIPSAFSSFYDLCFSSKTVYLLCSSQTHPLGICAFDPSAETFTPLLSTGKSYENYNQNIVCKNIPFKTKEGFLLDAFCYLPSLQNSPLPLILKVHSGPTTHVSPRLGLDILFFTSRGFAYAEFNYRGSTGYGKRVRESLNSHWGVADVEDTLSCIDALCESLPIQRDQLFIKGSSAGGLTTLLALCQTYRFRAGVCYYGISDLEKMTSHTHRFEAHYLEHLIGPYPEKKLVYHQRSPLFCHKIQQKPSILFFQGALDPVTPSEQTTLLYSQLKEHGADVDLHIFEKEGHGFRQYTTLVDCLEKELLFYQRHMQNFC